MEQAAIKTAQFLGEMQLHLRANRPLAAGRALAMAGVRGFQIRDPEQWRRAETLLKAAETLLLRLGVV